MTKAVANPNRLSVKSSDKSLTKKASLNAVAAVIDFMARLLVEFFLNPILVAGLGKYLYGLWQFLWKTNGYMLAASGRSAQALKWAVANQQSSTDHAEKRQMVGSAVAVWIISLPMMALVAGLLAWFLPRFIDIPAQYLWSARITTLLLCTNATLLSLADVPRAVLQGENLGYKRMGLSTILVFATGLFAALAIYLDLGIVGVAAANTVSTILTGVLFVQVARQQVVWFGIARPTGASIKRFFGLSWWFIIWKFINQLMMAGDVLVLGLFDSVEMVAVYSLTKYVPDAFSRMITTVVFGMAPGLGGVIGAGKLQKALRVRNEIMAFSWLFLTVSGATILVWNRAFLHLWVGGEYDAGALPTLLLIFMLGQLTIIRNDANVIDLTLDVSRKVLIGAASTVLAMGLSILLVGYFDMGITGVCIGFIVGYSILNWVYPAMIGQLLQVGMQTQLRGAIRPLLVTFFLLSGAVVLRSHAHAASWFILIPATGVTALVFLLVAAFVGLSVQQRTQLQQRLQHVLGFDVDNHE